MEKIQLEFTQEEIKLLLEIINGMNFQGTAIELIHPLKLKIKSVLFEEKSETKTDKKE